MLWLLTRLVVVPVKVAAGSFKLGYGTGRVLGYRRLFFVGVGVAVGLLVAPGPGAALRARLRERFEGGPPVGASTAPWTPTPTVVAPAPPVASRPPAGAGPLGAEVGARTQPPDAASSGGPTGAASAPSGSPVSDAGGDGPDTTDAVDADPLAAPAMLAAQADADATAGATDPLPAVPDADPIGGTSTAP